MGLDQGHRATVNMDGGQPGKIFLQSECLIAQGISHFLLWGLDYEGLSLEERVGSRRLERSGMTWECPS